MAYIQTSGGGRTWQRIVNPGTSWFAQKTSGWTADSFSGGLEVDFSSVVPAGTVAVYCVILQNTPSAGWSRPSGDTNISNTPNADAETSTRILRAGVDMFSGVLFLSSDYKIQIAVGNTSTDIYVSYPSAVLL